MKPSAEYHTESLAEWVVVATFGLADSACERIKLEIEAHFAEAVKAIVDAGARQHDAEGAALFELGDPKTAAKSFRRRHLTVEEEQQLARMLDSYRKWTAPRISWKIVALTIIPAGLCFLLLLLPATKGSGTFFMIMGAASLAMGPEYLITIRLLERAGPTSEMLRRMLALEAVSTLLSIGFWTAGIWSAGHLAHIVVLFLVLIVPNPAFRLAGKLRLWRKLRNLPADPICGVKA